MSTANIAYLCLVGFAFGAFAVALSYGYIRSNLPERRRPEPRATEKSAPLRKAA